LVILLQVDAAEAKSITALAAHSNDPTDPALLAASKDAAAVFRATVTEGDAYAHDAAQPDTSSQPPPAHTTSTLPVQF
jgi:hypothetical protein